MRSPSTDNPRPTVPQSHGIVTFFVGGAAHFAEHFADQGLILWGMYPIFGQKCDLDHNM